MSTKTTVSQPESIPSLWRNAFAAVAVLLAAVIIVGAWGVSQILNSQEANRNLACSISDLAARVPAAQFEGEPLSNFKNWLQARRHILDDADGCSAKIAAALEDRIARDDRLLSEIEETQKRHRDRMSKQARDRGSSVAAVLSRAGTEEVVDEGGSSPLPFGQPGGGSPPVVITPPVQGPEGPSGPPGGQGPPGNPAPPAQPPTQPVPEECTINLLGIEVCL